MATIPMDLWALCPFRSPCVPPKESSFAGTPPAVPTSVLGPCLFAACGLWKITKVEDGKVVDGMCGIRFIGETFNSIAGSLEQLVQLQKKREIEVPVGAQKGS
jgi:hypothetical protein